MVSRVSTIGQQQLLIAGIQENQSRVFDNQRQLTTGRETDEFRGLAGRTATVLGSRSFLSRVEGYQDTIATIRGRLDANDVQLGGIIGSVENLQDAVFASIANNTAEGFSEILDQTFQFLVSSLNSNNDGTFQFSGASTGTEPVTVSSLADLAALPSVSDAFQNSDIAFQARIADGVDIEFGILADDVATETFEILVDLYNFDNGPSGPLQGELDDTQFAFLQGQIGNFDNALTGLRQSQVENGLIFSRLDVIDDQHSDTTIFLETFISSQEDVDLAEVVTELNSNQLALEASFQAIASLSSLTLLNFI
jgi:flagellar hook-associated protein 3 FlgL